MFARRNNRCYDMSNNIMWQEAMASKSNEYMVNMPIDKKFENKKECGVNKEMQCGCQHQMCADPMPGCKMQPVYECPVEKCVHRTICHEVPQV